MVNKPIVKSRMDSDSESPVPYTHHDQKALIQSQNVKSCKDSRTLAIIVQSCKN